MKLEALNRRVYACIGENEGGHIRENSGFVVTERGVVVIDTTWTLRDAEWMTHEIRKVTDKKVIYVINTHCHVDHVFGNQVFPVPVIAAQSTLDRMRSSVAHEWSPQNLFQKSLSYRGAGTSPDYPDPERLKEVHIVLPEIAFELQMTLNLGELELEIALLGGHTPDSSVVCVLTSTKSRQVLTFWVLSCTSNRPLSSRRRAERIWAVAAAWPEGRMALGNLTV